MGVRYYSCHKSQEEMNKVAFFKRCKGLHAAGKLLLWGDSSTRARFCGVPSAWLSKPQMGMYSLDDVYSTFQTSASTIETWTYSQIIFPCKQLRMERAPAGRVRARGGERARGRAAAGAGQPVTAAGVWHILLWRGARTRHKQIAGRPCPLPPAGLPRHRLQRGVSELANLHLDWVHVPPVHRYIKGFATRQVSCRRVALL